MEVNEKFCPVCKNKIERDAVACKHCGALLDQSPWDAAATTVNADALDKDPAQLAESLIKKALIPERGIAVYVAGASQPMYLNFDKVLVFGRKRDAASDDTLLDLTAAGGYQMGLSRRHAMIRRTETGFELVDLSSTNGSWMGNEKLVPYQPYPLKSGAQLRLGRMKILVIHSPVSDEKKTG